MDKKKNINKRNKKILNKKFSCIIKQMFERNIINKNSEYLQCIKNFHRNSERKEEEVITNDTCINCSPMLHVFSCAVFDRLYKMKFSIT